MSRLHRALPLSELPTVLHHQDATRARIVFAGTPDFAVPALNALLASRHTVVTVLTQPDRPSGRGRKLQPGPVKAAAVAAGIPVLQPLNLKQADIQAELQRLSADLFVVVAYGLLLPAAVLAIPRLACVNVHASLLPRWRGASPIQSAIRAGDTETGISIMQMDAGLDTGPVYCAERLSLQPGETAGELHDRLAKLGGQLLQQNLDAILAGELQAVPQAETGVTYAGRISKADGIIDWNASAVTIDQRIRAYNPWPVAQSLLDGEPLRCWSSALLHTTAAGSAPPGTVLGVSAAGIDVQTGDGVLTLTEVQAAGRKRIAAREFANSQSLADKVLGC